MKKPWIARILFLLISAVILSSCIIPVRDDEGGRHHEEYGDYHGEHHEHHEENEGYGGYR